MRYLPTLIALLLPTTARASSSEVDAQIARCQELIRRNDLPGLKACAEEVERLAPDSLDSNMLQSEVAVGEGRLHDAARLLDRAHAAGLPDNVYEIKRGRIEEWIRIKGGEPPARPREQTRAYKAGRLAAQITLGAGAVLFLWLVLRRRRSS